MRASGDGQLVPRRGLRRRLLVHGTRHGLSSFIGVEILRTRSPPGAGTATAGPTLALRPGRGLTSSGGTLPLTAEGDASYGDPVAVQMTLNLPQMGQAEVRLVAGWPDIGSVNGATSAPQPPQPPAREAELRSRRPLRDRRVTTVLPSGGDALTRTG